MKQLIKLVEVYESNNTAFVRCGDICPELRPPWIYLQQQEHAGYIEVQWTQHPKIRLTKFGYEKLNANKGLHLRK